MGTTISFRMCIEYIRMDQECYISPFDDNRKNYNHFNMIISNIILKNK